MKADKATLKAYAEVLKTHLDDFLDLEIKSQHEICVFYTDNAGLVVIERPEKLPAGEVKGEKISEIKLFGKLGEPFTKNTGVWLVFDNKEKMVITDRKTHISKSIEKKSWSKKQAIADANEFLNAMINFGDKL